MADDRTKRVKGGSWTGVECEAVVMGPDDRPGPVVRSGHYVYVVQSGRLLVRSGRREEVAGPGCLVLCPAWLRREILPAAEPVRMLVVRIRLSAFAVEVRADAEALAILMGLARWTDRRGCVLSRSMGADRRLLGVLDRMVAAFAGGEPARDLVLKAGALELLAFLAQADELHEAVTAGMGAMPAYRNVMLALQYIEGHYAEDLGIEELARAARLSRSHFQAVFRAYAGMPARVYLAKYRAGMACRALATTDASVAQIAFDCGFGSVSRFYETFRQCVGQPPAAFRKRGSAA